MYRAQRVATAAVTTGIAAAIALSGCSTGSSDPQPTAATATSSTITDPAALVNAAAEATAALTGAHLRVEVTGKIPNLTAKAVEADVATDPSTAAKGTATVLLGDSEVSAPFVYIDDHLYADIGGNGYVDYGNGQSIYDVSAVLDPEKGLANLLRQMKNPSTTGAEDIDGTATTKITGTVAANVLSPLTGVNVPDGQDTPVPISVWITASHQLAQAVLTPAPDASMTLGLSQWNEQVEVSKPTAIVAPSATTSPAPGDASRAPA